MQETLNSFFSEIYRYFRKNKIVIIFFFSAILIGATNLFGISKQPIYKSWEFSSFVFTFGYTIVLYFAGYRKKYFDSLGGNKTAVVIVANLSLCLITLILANDIVKIFNFHPKRIYSLVLMFIFALIFSFLNWILHRHFERMETEVDKNNILYKDLSISFRNTVFMSDLPTAITFLVLTIYYLFIRSCIQMEYFFSGAIAFQMMSSNAVWIFNDDRFMTTLKGDQ